MKKNELEAKMKELKEQEAAALQSLSDIREQMAHIEDGQWAAKARFIADVFGEGFDEFYRTISMATKAETNLLKPYMLQAVDDWSQKVAEERMNKRTRRSNAASSVSNMPAKPSDSNSGSNPNSDLNPDSKPDSNSDSDSDPQTVPAGPILRNPSIPFSEDPMMGA